MNIIKSIEQFSEKTLGDWCKFDGYKISTTKGSIEIGIDNQQGCCENWGYISSSDNLKDFYGAEIIEVKYTQNINELLKTTEMQLDEQCCELDQVYFITIETSKGTLQFAVYNEHNGYYGHSCYVSCDFINEMNLKMVL